MSKEEKKDIHEEEWLSSVGGVDESKYKGKSLALKKLYVEYLAARRKIIEARHYDPLEEVSDHIFQDFDGTDVKLSELFGKKDELIVIINMVRNLVFLEYQYINMNFAFEQQKGTKCPMCTLWADGFSGVIQHLEDAAAFCLMSNDPPEVQAEFHKSRSWRFRMVSGSKNTFTKDLSLETTKELMPGCSTKPGVCTFQKNGGKIYRTARDSFGSNDHYNPVFRLVELLKGGYAGVWWPKIDYE